MNKVLVLIPAYRPDEKLIHLVRQLALIGMSDIVIVIDGLDGRTSSVVERLREMVECHLVFHVINLGKGRALKTGINYCLHSFKDAIGIVTADADGQHLPEDIKNIAETLIDNPTKLILGVRTFDRNVPIKSKIGNILTRHVVSYLMGRKITDTQTGLRGIPVKDAYHFLKISGEKYEYEINMLMETTKQNIAIMEVPIRTVYIENNRGSHFNPLWDSMRIYFVLARYFLSSLGSFIVDNVIFAATFTIFSSMLFSLIIARCCSLFFNFALNQSFVFLYKGGIGSAFIRYLALVVLSGGIAYYSIYGMVNYGGFNVYISKIIVESFLFFANFTIQQRWVFNKKAII